MQKWYFYLKKAFVNAFMHYFKNMYMILDIICCNKIKNCQRKYPDYLFQYKSRAICTYNIRSVKFRTVDLFVHVVRQKMSA